eukprot:CAMPEP_0201285448 /NCGR_PEP_ID=MMETSP1317-20130820/108100_1 /ASSEMBLY_ACC=CAM_ASM_000770 /TAXON_ID=187299 /ORGANISM="Undescribed Undescribed, Strain Undescribed" /LENGTH=56 /DNA_ID=CAMNT_0047610355 /DNA_START=610 /DNA_END=780 /DNA_ORIENTATION=-
MAKPSKKGNLNYQEPALIPVSVFTMPRKLSAKMEQLMKPLAFPGVRKKSVKRREHN